MDEGLIGEPDVIDEIVKDHGEIKALFHQVESTMGDQKHEAFEALVHKLAVHETAEQEVVHPLLRDADERVMQERLTEEKEAETELNELYDMGTKDPLFQVNLERLKNEVLEHAETEEAQEHPKIRASVDRQRLERLAAVFRAAEATSPTRPHPNAPTSPAAKAAVGPIVAIMDRARDGIRDAMQKLGS
jgi:hypothetical protein